MAAYASTVDTGYFPFEEAGKTVSSFLQAENKKMNITMVNRIKELIIMQDFSYDRSFNPKFNRQKSLKSTLTNPSQFREMRHTAPQNGSVGIGSFALSP